VFEVKVGVRVMHHAFPVTGANLFNALLDELTWQSQLSFLHQLKTSADKRFNHNCSI